MARQLFLPFLLFLSLSLYLPLSLVLSLSLLFFFLLWFFYAFQNISYHSLDYSLAALALPSLTPRAVHRFSTRNNRYFLSSSLSLVAGRLHFGREEDCRARVSLAENIPVYAIPFCCCSNASAVRDQAKDYSLVPRNSDQEIRLERDPFSHRGSRISDNV